MKHIPSLILIISGTIMVTIAVVVLFMTFSGSFAFHEWLLIGLGLLGLGLKIGGLLMLQKEAAAGH